MIVNFIFIRRNKLSWKTEVCDFDVHLLIQKNVLGFDVAVSEPLFVKMTYSPEQLFKDVSGSFLLEHFSLVYQTEQLSILGYFHHIIHYSVYFAVYGSVYSADIEVNYLNDIPMFCLQADLDLVQKHVEGFLLIPPLDIILLYFVIHYLNGYSLVIREFQSHFNSWYNKWGTWKIFPILTWTAPYISHQLLDTTKGTLSASPWRTAFCNVFLIIKLG